MSDLEQRLAESLSRAAHEAPAASGLADAARRRAGTRRRNRVGALAVAVVLGAGVPAAVVAGNASDGGQTRRPGLATGGPAAPSVPDGMRAESWHGVTIEVPDTWGYGDPSTWCAGGGQASDHRVGRPGPSESIACSPASSYGVTFSEANGEGPDWPVYPQHSGAWPDGAFVGVTTVGGVVVTVAAEDLMTAQAVIGSARVIGVEGDPNGCTASRGEAPPVEVPPGVVRICRYDAQGLLEQSELLTGDDAEEATRALQDAPQGMLDCEPSPAPPETVVMSGVLLRAVIELDGACTAIEGLDAPRVADQDVLYWALSPGWSGDATGLRLPPELRQQ